MKIKVIDFGYKHLPKRAHYDDCGADVYATCNTIINPGSIFKMPLGFGLEIPNGYAGFIFPRSGMSSKGITAELPPIDAGYRGEIHAILTNNGHDSYHVHKGDRVGQLVILPCVIADFVEELGDERGEGAFNSTGK